MTIQIQLTSAVGSGLAVLARMKGLSLDEYVQGLLESLAIPNLPVSGGMTPEQAAEALHEWANQFPYRRRTPLPDDAISRETIYRRAGNE